MTLGRIIRRIHAERYSLVRVDWLTKVFVTGDILSFLIQGSAAGIMSMGSHASMGQDIVIVGLVIQVVMFALFIITAVVFQVRMHHYPTREAFDDSLPWKTLYAVCRQPAYHGPFHLSSGRVCHGAEWISINPMNGPCMSLTRY